MATKKDKVVTPTVPAAPAVPSAPKAPKAEKQAKAPKEPKVPVVLDEKNGVTRPASGKTKQVWDVADEMSKAAKAPVSRADLTERLLKEGLVVGTIHTQYGKWRKYHGLVVVKESKPVEAPAETAQAATE